MISATLAAQDVALPESARRQIDAAYPGWRLARVIPEVEAEIRERTPTWPPNLILGDFDGNRQTDIALLVEYADAAMSGGRAVRLLALLGDGTGFTMAAIEKAAPHDARQFLHLIRQAGEPDTIGVEFEAIGGHVWSYRNGKWQSSLAP